MPHLIIEYTSNLKSEADIPSLLQQVNQTLLQYEIIPVGGLRTRAICLEDYLVADGTANDAFVHAVLKLGKGRTEEQISAVSEDLFTTIERHFQTIFEKHYLALSLEIKEFERPTLKKNNIHTRYK